MFPSNKKYLDKNDGNFVELVLSTGNKATKNEAH